MSCSKLSLSQLSSSLALLLLKLVLQQRNSRARKPLISGAAIRLDDLRYWSVRHQAPYASAQIASEALSPR